MGNYFSNNNYIDNCLKMERILDRDLIIGIGSCKNNKSLQAVRLGDITNKYHRLNKFTEEENKLTYHFDNDITFILEKIDNNIWIDIGFFKNTQFIGKKILDPIIRKNYKKICFDSYEFDKIYDFIQE
jgi:hypothetical protein